MLHGVSSVSFNGSRVAEARLRMLRNAARQRRASKLRLLQSSKGARAPAELVLKTFFVIDRSGLAQEKRRLAAPFKRCRTGLS
jgi:hypothetical protein